MLGKLITGGFFKGYRTYVMGGVIVLDALAKWSIGDISLIGLLEMIPQIAAGFGLMSLRAAVPSLPK